MFDPKSIQSPSDIPEGLTLVADGDETLELSLPRKLGFDFHWLREASLGNLQGDLGLRVRPEADVSIHLKLSGNLKRLISLDERKWLRLQVFKRQDRAFLFASGLTVTAQAKTPEPEGLEELAAALLGVHQTQWFDALRKRLDAAGGKLGVKVPGVLLDAAPLIARGNWAAALEYLKEYSLERVAPAAVERGLKNYAEYQRLDGWVQQQIGVLFGVVESDRDLARIWERLRPVLDVKDSIYEKAVSALEQKFKAEVSYHFRSSTEEAALLDCSFEFGEAGLAAYRRALDGDYSAALLSSNAHVEVRQAVLTHKLGQESVLELHLPYLGRKEWARRLDVFARMEVESGEDGRILVYHVDGTDRVTRRNSYQSALALAGRLSVGGPCETSTFTLSYAESRRIAVRQAGAALAPVLSGYGFEDAVGGRLSELGKSEGDADVSLSLTVPATLVKAWFNAPGEREPVYFDVYSRVSVAVQRAMRQWLPYVYFQDEERYETLSAAFPLLVYQASRPSSGKPRSEFTYDVLNDSDMERVFQSALRGLPGVLARVRSLLLARRPGRTAGFYHPSEAPSIVDQVRRRPLLLKSLLVADAFFVNALMELGCRGRRVTEEIASDPQGAVKDLVRFSAEFSRTFHGKLRRLYAGGDFLPLGSMLLVEATNALGTLNESDSGIQAVLKIRHGEGGAEQTFVNRAYRV